MVRVFEKISDFIATWAGFLLSVGAIYSAGPFPYMDQGVRLGGAVGLGSVVIILARPLISHFDQAPINIKRLLCLIDLLLLAGISYALYKFYVVYDSLWDGILILEFEAVLVGAIGVLIVVETVRRAFGLVLSVACLLAIIYAYFGNIPGMFGHKGFSVGEIVEASWFSFSGVFGQPTDIVTSVVLVFIVFGGILESTGATGILLKMATAATARIRGGAAHSAIIASAMFGTISGSVVANVVGTGVFTIPLIKKQGFKNAFAGAVEAAASSAGQFTPPIMASVAFIMAELINRPYLEIAVAAAIPAFFYYLSLFGAVHAEALRLGIEPLPKDQRPVVTMNDWFEAMRFLVPLVFVVVVLFNGWTASMAGFVAICTAVISGIVIDLFNPAKRKDLFKYPIVLIKSLQRSGFQCGQIMTAVATIGIVIAVVRLTGLAGSFAELVSEMAEGTLFAALVITVLACIVMGMGLPTLPAYLFIILFVGPIIENMGIDPLLIHLFVLYYGVLSNLTPPVAIAAYAAAPIANSNPTTTGLYAVRVSAVGFIIPFIIIYYPSITLVVDFDLKEFIWIVVRLPLAIWLIATGFIGCDRKPLSFFERIIRLALAIVSLLTIPILQVIGFISSAAMVLFHRLKFKNREPLKVL